MGAGRDDLSPSPPTHLTATVSDWYRYIDNIV